MDDSHYQSSLQQLEDALYYALSVYRFCIAALPDTEQSYPVRVGAFGFAQPSQVEGYVIEIGWAFFVRMEAALESHALRIGHANVLNVLAELDLTEEETKGYVIAREIRNTLHHGDGDTSLLRNPPRHIGSDSSAPEPHLLPEHIERLHNLFGTIGRAMAEYAQTQQHVPHPPNE